METLILEKKDEVYLTVDADPSIQREISEFFTFYVPGYKFMPQFRNRMGMARYDYSLKNIKKSILDYFHISKHLQKNEVTMLFVAKMLK